MNKISVLNIKGEKVKDITLNENVFGIEPNDAVLYDAITLTMNSLRQASANTKTRSEVSGGGKKPWRQKGTGRARQGSTRAPHWYHGGVVFGPKPDRNYTKKMNKKERRLALKSALSYKLIDSELIVLDSFIMDSAKTKDAIKIMQNLKIDNEKTLIVVDKLEENLVLATRNLANVVLLQTDEINTLDVIASNCLVITEEAVKKLEEVLA